MSKAILAIDTSDRSADVALGINTRVSSHQASDTKSVEQLPLLLSECLNDLQVDINDISHVCVSMGPGSFTGIRAGVAYAQGISIARDIPLIGVSSLLSRAHSALKDEGEHLVCLTASKVEYFAQRVRVLDGSTMPIGPIHTLAIEDAKDSMTMPAMTLLDSTAGAKSLIDFYCSYESGPKTKLDLDKYAEHVILADKAMGINPLYAKAVAAKTLKERGLRE